jgi:hypothetical protein
VPLSQCFIIGINRLLTVFDPGMLWTGFRKKRSGSDIQVFQMYSLGREVFLRLESAGEIIGCQEVGKVSSKLFVVFGVEPFDVRR